MQVKDWKQAFALKTFEENWMVTGSVQIQKANESPQRVEGEL